MIAPDLNSIAQLATSRMADSLVEGTLIAVLTGSMLVVARRLTSNVRFAVWFSAMIAIASLTLAGREGWSSSHLQSTLAHPVLVVPGSWGLYVFAVWAVIAGLLLARVGVGVLHVFRLRNSCVPLDSLPVNAELREAFQLHGISRRVVLCTSHLVSVPTAIGFIRPVVVLPVWLLEELSAGELKQLVSHELAHLRRYDDWTNLAQQIVKALFFFHPAVWWIEKRISLEREMACDDAVIAETADPHAYAECLTHLAEKSMIRRGLALAQAALGRMRQTSLRLAEILRGDRRPARRHSAVAGAAVVAGLAVACGVTASRAPRLIAFSPEEPQIAASHSFPRPQVALARQISHEPPVIHQASAGSTKPVPRAVETEAKAHNAAARLSESAKTENSVVPQTGMVLPARWDESTPNPTPATRDVYFVVESCEHLPLGVVLYRTSVYRITVTHPAADDPTTRIPRKET